MIPDAPDPARPTATLFGGVATVICVLDRGIGGRARLAENQIILQSLLTPNALDAKSVRCTN